MNRSYLLPENLLSEYKYLTRQEIASKLQVKSGGMLTDVLSDLQICGFIEKNSVFIRLY